MEFVDARDGEMRGCGEGWVLDNLERLHDNSYLLRERRDGKIRLAMTPRTRKTVGGDEDGHGKDVLPSPSCASWRSHCIAVLTRCNVCSSSRA
jgi:hypothetical protein